MKALPREQFRKVAQRNQTVLDKIFSDTVLHTALPSDQGHPLISADKTATLRAGGKTLIV